MVLVVLLVLALFVLQTLLPTRLRVAPAAGDPSPTAESLGNRDHQRPHTVVGQRAVRALANMQEALPVFLALALMNMIVAPSAGLAVTGAWVFLLARTLYVAIYLAGVAVVRTIVWVVGWVGLILMILTLLDRIA
ncbi:MAG TPA: MAPEG family protein [Steroidobacteraceae bacterium]|nr:MAPEG family protein [Steroidobacteraceae bacterium]